MLRFFCILFFSLAAASAAPPDQQPLVLVSIPPYQEIVERIAGSTVEVMAVAPPSSDPHTYEPTAKQVGKLSKATVWFQIGEPFEKKLGKAIGAKKIDLREGLQLIHEEHQCHHCSHDGEDRHIWMSLTEMNRQAKQITAALIELFPKHKERFEEGLLKLQKDLAIMDVAIQNRLSSLEHRTFVVSHPAFAYFCRDYDLKQLSVEREGKEPRPKELEALLKEASQEHPCMAVTIPQHNNRGTQLVAKKLDLPVYSIDPYSPHYFETLQQLSSALHDSN